MTAREFNMVSDISSNEVELSFEINAPRSAAFSHTFVLDHMPDAESAGAADYWKHVRVSFKYTPTSAGFVDESFCKVLGGTKQSSLIAVRWSRDVEHINYADEVPDGGDLG